MQPKTPRESVLEARCRDLAKAAGCLFPKWVSPGNAGVPDRLLIGQRGGVVFVELKTPHGRLTALQELWKRRLESRGHRYACIRTVDEFCKLLATVADPTRLPKNCRGSDL
jgi:hypothetical protein